MTLNLTLTEIITISFAGGLSWYVYDAAQVIPSKLKTPSLSLFLFFHRSIRVRVRVKVRVRVRVRVRGGARCSCVQLV